MSEPLGATPADWWTFDVELGLGAHLLPCVPYSPDVRVAAGSSLAKKVGKIPSSYNGAGEAHGLKDWPKRIIAPEEVVLWARDRRLNICVRTGEISGTYAIDVDVEDEQIAHEIAVMIGKYGEPPAVRRMRSNSHKFLAPFRMEGESCKKRIITVVPENKALGVKPQRIELLANGQQFVAAGTHSSGARYDWVGGLPSSLPLLTLSQLNTIWSALADAFGTASPIDTSSIPSSTSPTTETTAGEVLTQISEDDWQSLIQALRFLLPHAGDNDVWSQIGYALLSIRYSRPAETLWNDFSRKSVGYEPGAPEAWWKAHDTQQPRSDYRHVFALARSLGWSLTSSGSEFPVIVRPTLGGSTEDLDVTPSPIPDKPIIQIADARLVQNIAQMSDIIRPDVFTQGNMLTRLGRENLDDEIRRGADQIIMLPVSTGWARVRFTDIAQFKKMLVKKNEWIDCSCPADLASVWADQGDWPNLRPLDAITRAPFVRADGSICDDPGYDPRSRALYIPSLSFPVVPESPTVVEARIALERLLLPFDQFPWYTPGSRSAFAAHILTEVARLAVDRVPMFWYTAPDAGTGKTMLSEAAATIVHGYEPAVRPWVQDGDELRKTLFASLLAGDRSIAFDNVPTGYKARAPELCAFLTSAIWKDRKLGVSETHAVPNKAVVSASGNNVTPVSDLARRCLVVRLDANTERLAERRFKIPNLRGYLLEHRPHLLVDALTIIKAYTLSTALDVIPLPSFESWSRLVREPLIWLGMPDPCETQKTETDDETRSVAGVFEKLAVSFRGGLFTCVDVARIVGGILDSDGELHAMMLATGCSEPSSSQKIGYWLRSLRDKNAGGYKLVHAGDSKFGVKWQFKKLNEDLT